MTRAVALTPQLVHRHVETGQVYGAGRRRYVRIVRIDRRVNIDPPYPDSGRRRPDGDSTKEYVSR